MLVAAATLTPVFATGAQDASRVCLSRAILHGHLSNDYCLNGPYARDKATYKGHLYSDKAPGMSLLEVPAVAAARDPRYPELAVLQPPPLVRTADDERARLDHLRLPDRPDLRRARPGIRRDLTRHVRARDARRPARDRELRARDGGPARPRGVLARLASASAARRAGRGSSGPRGLRGGADRRDRPRLHPGRAGDSPRRQVPRRHPARSVRTPRVQRARVRRLLASLLLICRERVRLAAILGLLRHPPALPARDPPGLLRRQRPPGRLAGRCGFRLRPRPAREAIPLRSDRVRRGRRRFRVPRVRLLRSLRRPVAGAEVLRAGAPLFSRSASGPRSPPISSSPRCSRSSRSSR